MSSPTFGDRDLDPTQRAFEEMMDIPEPPRVPIKLRPPTSQPIDAADMYRELQFDPEGDSETQAFLRSAYPGFRGRRMSTRAFDAVENQMAAGNLPKNNPYSPEADAYRHAIWSYMMAKELGYVEAKRFGDAHEISSPNNVEERLKDLYNNEVGRQLAADPANRNRSDEEVVIEALRAGRLMISPFNVTSPGGPP